MTEIQSEQGGQNGKVFISDDILAVIAAKAAVEVEGVAGIGNFSNAKAIKKSMPKGVNITVAEQTVRVALAVNVKMGAKLHEISKEVQEHVKTAIETMTGLDVAEVNIRISTIIPEKKAAEKKPLERKPERRKA